MINRHSPSMRNRVGARSDENFRHEHVEFRSATNARICRGVGPVDRFERTAAQHSRNVRQGGGQASALGGRVQLFTSATPMFANGVHLPEAVTADIPSVSNPLGISINNAFGPLWFPSGWAECHATRLRVGSHALYSDLLLHDLGPGLDDGFIQGRAQGRDWRTTAVRGAGMRRRFVHDGRARTIRDAVPAHDGEAEHSVQRHRLLDLNAQDAVVRFVASL